MKSWSLTRYARLQNQTFSAWSFIWYGSEQRPNTGHEAKAYPLMRYFAHRMFKNLIQHFKLWRIWYRNTGFWNLFKKWEDLATLDLHSHRESIEEDAVGWPPSARPSFFHVPKSQTVHGNGYIHSLRVAPLGMSAFNPRLKICLR